MLHRSPAAGDRSKSSRYAGRPASVVWVGWVAVSCGRVLSQAARSALVVPTPSTGPIVPSGGPANGPTNTPTPSKTTDPSPCTPYPASTGETRYASGRSSVLSQPAGTVNCIAGVRDRVVVCPGGRASPETVGTGVGVAVGDAEADGEDTGELVGDGPTTSPVLPRIPRNPPATTPNPRMTAAARTARAGESSIPRCIRRTGPLSWRVSASSDRIVSRRRSGAWIGASARIQLPTSRSRRRSSVVMPDQPVLPRRRGLRHRRQRASPGPHSAAGT